MHGTVLPERDAIYGSKTSFEGGSRDETFHIRVTWSISLSKVTALAEVLRGDLHASEVSNSVAFLIRRHLDAIGFSLASGYDLDLYSVVEEGKEPQILGVRVDELVEEAKAGPAPEKLYAAAERSLELTRALEEWREAVRRPHDTAFHSYRAIEALKDHFVGADEKQSWKALRASLHIEEAGLIWLSKRSTKERHGELLDAPTGFRIAVLRYTRSVIERFALYLNDESFADTADLKLEDPQGTPPPSS